jgi:hypothetical protein|tara:strand:+ start:598 stop:732 length:135 start_codon:yes stop_codon:yes gene_type:complete
VQIDLEHMNTSSSRPQGSVTKNMDKFKNTKAESIDEEYDDDDFD